MALKLMSTSKQKIMNKTFCALLAGVVIGILIAPAKGSETRRRIMGALEEFQKEPEDEGEELYQYAEKPTY